MAFFKRKDKVFDKDMKFEEHTPSIGEVNFEEDYFMTNPPISKDELVKEYQDYWINYKKYRELKGLKSFDETIKEVKELTTENFKYPNVHFTIKNKHGIKATIKLSQYSRLFAELKLDDQSYNRLRQNQKVEDYLSKYISVWNKNKKVGYGKNVHLLWNDHGKALNICISSKDLVNFQNEVAEYKWFNEIVGILETIFTKYNDINSRIDTYSPKELEKFTIDNKLVGKTIEDVIFNEGVSDVYKEVLELWKAITFKLNDDSKVSFEFWNASHVKSVIYDSDAVLKDAKDYYGEIKKAHAFLKPIIGQKIIDIKIESAKECDCHSVEDEGFNENQESFIVDIQIVLENGKTILMHDGDDFMYVAIK